MMVLLIFSPMKRVNALGWGGLLGFLVLQGAQSQVRINEVMASNTRSFPDIVDFEDYPDWIELHNPDEVDVNLEGYFLSDDRGEPYRWPFPAEAVIPAGGYLLVMADGHDAGPGESHPRGYWPWRNFTTERYHSNFSLSADGESVVLSRIEGASNTTLVATGAIWHYLDDGSDLSTQWRARTYDDSGWASGPADLGYGDDPVTVVGFGGDENDKHITTYFRHRFMADPSVAAEGLTLSLQVDDGAVVFLNGEEVVRENLPSGTVTSTTEALSAVGGSDESDFSTYQISPDLLIAGENILAVEVHQAGPRSSDIRFDLSLTGRAFSGGSTIDAIDYGIQVTDVAYGRDPVAPAVWKQLAVPTPGRANDPLEVTNLRGTSGAVEVSPLGGLYAETQTVSLSSSAGEIYYTLDGSDPSPSSLRYTAPLEVSSTTIVRARVYEEGKVPGQIVTSSYLFGETFNGLPVVSAVAPPETLFGDEIGIYDNDHEPVRSGMNEVYKGKDAPGHIEFFPADGGRGFQANGGFRIGGENNWGTHDQKALNFTLRGKYGSDAIKYDLFPGSQVPLHTSISFREGGDDWDDAMMRDAFWNPIAAGHLEAETNGAQSCVVFLNGEYWGVYNIRSRWNEEWFFEHYGVDVGAYDHIGYGHFTSSATTLGAYEGDTTDWVELLAFVDSHDLNDPAHWAFVESRVDLESFIDFIVAESFANNTSWRHNREMWKAHKPGSRWRWCLPDMDRTFKIASINDNEFDAILREDALLVRLKNVPVFQARLAQRYAAHVASTFHPVRIGEIADAFAARMAPALDRHKAKWSGSIDAAHQAGDVQEIKDYTTRRHAEVHDEISSELGIDSAVELTLVVNGAGTFLLEGVPVEAGTLKVFPNLPTTIEAVPAPGFAFDSWVGIEGGATATFTPAGPSTVTVNFVPTSGSVTGGALAVDTTLTPAGSPYLVTSDLVVPPGITLTIEPGVVLEMGAGSHLRVMGTLQVLGEQGREVFIGGRNGAPWGGLSFEEPTTLSTLSHLIVRQATRGKDSTRYPAGISGLNATVEIDFLDISGERGPLFFRGGSTILRDSVVEIPITGDGINIKGGYAETYRTTFTGNNSVDTDAIDYDGVVDGVIKDCRIYLFQGFNSDGIDTGEECRNVLIEGNTIFFSSDKGISVGQGSTVVMKNNLIVGCQMGVGVKDEGSFILVDQNTFVDCLEGVAVYEKNFGKGGGVARITNTIFSRCEVPLRADGYSYLETSYSLSDTTLLDGTANLHTDPLFVDPTALNFELQPASPALDSGDPNHDPDPDASPADRGAFYRYSPDHYPFETGETVVINEVLANSGLEPDWIELYNRTSESIEVGGWFLSDDGSDLTKYRIAPGTVIPAHGYLVFYEDLNFGPESSDPNRVTGFGLSKSGETLHLSSAENDLLTGYRYKENFGASLEGVSMGTYYKPGSGTWNFVPLQEATVMAPNAPPTIGPIVISEIMYNPAGSGDSEYLELFNISSEPVSLFDEATGKAWLFSDGIEHEFPMDPSLVMEPGERIILTRSLPAFQAAFSVPPGTRVFEWLVGGLSGSGETVELARPGPIDDFGAVRYVRVDRVKYADTLPWPTGPDGNGSSLTKVADYQYGNDHLNWRAAAPSPGAAAPGLSYDDWADLYGASNPNDDLDGDGLSNIVEYATGSDPTSPGRGRLFDFSLTGSAVRVSFAIDALRPDADLVLESSSDLKRWAIVNSPPVGWNGEQQLHVVNDVINPQTAVFYRLRVKMKP